jgi:hypothetical protein
MIPVLGQAKAVHASDRAAAVIGSLIPLFSLNISNESYRPRIYTLIDVLIS